MEGMLSQILNNKEKNNENFQIKLSKHYRNKGPEIPARVARQEKEMLRPVAEIPK